MTFEVIIGILLAGILSNNYALVEFLGTGAVIENERSKRRSLIVGGLTTLVSIGLKYALLFTVCDAKDPFELQLSVILS